MLFRIGKGFFAVVQLIRGIVFKLNFSFEVILRIWGIRFGEREDIYFRVFIGVDIDYYLFSYSSLKVSKVLRDFLGSYSSYFFLFLIVVEFIFRISLFFDIVLYCIQVFFEFYSWISGQVFFVFGFCYRFFGVFCFYFLFSSWGFFLNIRLIICVFLIIFYYFCYIKCRFFGLLFNVFKI